MIGFFAYYASDAFTGTAGKPRLGTVKQIKPISEAYFADKAANGGSFTTLPSSGVINPDGIPYDSDSNASDSASSVTTYAAALFAVVCALAF